MGTQRIKSLPITKLPKRADRNPTRTRQQILQAAEKEFAAKGFEGARLAKIATGASVQQALIYHYFDSKEALYEEVMKAGLGATTEQVWDLIEVMRAAVSGGAREKKMHRNDIEAIVKAFVDLVTHFYSEHASLVGMLHFEVRRGDRALKFVEDRVRPMFEAVVKELERMRARGDVRTHLDVRHFVISAVSMIAYPIEDGGLVGAVWPGIDAVSTQRRESIVRLLTEALIS